MKYNILSEFIEYQRSSLSLCVKKIIDNYYDEEYFNSLFKVYVECRYYDYYDRKDNSLEDNICKHLQKKAIELTVDNSEENILKIKEILFCFNFILYLDEVRTSNDNSNFVNYVYNYRKKLLNNDDIEFKDYFLKFTDDIKYKKDKFVHQFNCNDFYATFVNTSREDVFDVRLNYRLEFPKLYSDYAIDRVFNTGVINEDKLSIEYIFVTLKILEDVRACIFDKYYLIDFASSLFEKKTKVEGIFVTIDNDCVKDKVSLKINYDDYCKYKDNIYDMMKDGYSFAIFVDDKEIGDESFFEKLEMFKFIVINNDSKYCQIMSSNDKIIKVDSR